MEPWIEVRRAVLAEGMSKRAACRKFGIHWDTLQRILHDAVPPGYVRKQAREKSVIAPWLGRLGELIEANRDLPRKQRYTVKRMWQVLDGEGFTGGYTTVKDAVREIRKEATREVFMPLTQPPGEAQVDFGQAVARIGGRMQKVNITSSSSSCRRSCESMRPWPLSAGGRTSPSRRSCSSGASGN